MPRLYSISRKASARQALNTASRRVESPRQPRGMGVPAKTIAFHGGKGGVGTTFLAAESAAALSAQGLRVAAVEAGLHRGGLHYRLDVPLTRETFTLADLLPVLDDLTDRALDNALSECPCGARLLPSSNGVGLEPFMTSERFEALAPALAARFDQVIFDTPSLLDGAAIASLAAADLVVLVVTPELGCLGGARQALGALAESGVGSRKPALIVNRSLGDQDTITLSDIESFLDLPVTIVLPEETARCRRVTDEGRFAFQERSTLGQGIGVMVRRLFSCP